MRLYMGVTYIASYYLVSCQLVIEELLIYKYLFNKKTRNSCIFAVEFTGEFSEKLTQIIYIRVLSPKFSYLLFHLSFKFDEVYKEEELDFESTCANFERMGVPYDEPVSTRKKCVLMKPSICRNIIEIY